MKKMLFLMFALVLTANLQAQTYYGYLTRSVGGYHKGEGVMYQKTQSGKIMLQDAAEYSGAYSPGIVRFSGYYVGEIIDPCDDYVNVRKGPGTKYGVVRIVHTKEWGMMNSMAGHPTDSGRFFYQKTNSNWWKLYERPGKFIGYIYYDRLDTDVLPEYY